MIATLSVSNFKHLSQFNLPKNIVFCADDGPNAPSLKTLNESMRDLKNKGYEVQMIQLSQIKTDFNDVHKHFGIQAVKELLRPREIELEL